MLGQRALDRFTSSLLVCAFGNSFFSFSTAVYSGKECTAEHDIANVRKGIDVSTPQISANQIIIIYVHETVLRTPQSCSRYEWKAQRPTITSTGGRSTTIPQTSNHHAIVYNKLCLLYLWINLWRCVSEQREKKNEGQSATVRQFWSDDFKLAGITLFQ
jgi:hypothetical protein